MRETTRKELIFFASVLSTFALLVTGLNVWSSSSAKANESIHKAMSNILEQEVPREVFELKFSYVGAAQICTLSSASHSQSAAFEDTPHEVKLSGNVFRQGGTKAQWVGLNQNYWVTAPFTSGVRRDGDAVSADDFRQIVRRCVAAVRAETHRTHPWALTSQQNRDSWNAVAAQNKIATGTNNSNGMRE